MALAGGRSARCGATRTTSCPRSAGRARRTCGSAATARRPARRWSERSPPPTYARTTRCRRSSRRLREDLAPAWLPSRSPSRTPPSDTSARAARGVRRPRPRLRRRLPRARFGFLGAPRRDVRRHRRLSGLTAGPGTRRAPVTTSSSTTCAGCPVPTAPGWSSKAGWAPSPARSPRRPRGRRPAAHRREGAALASMAAPSTAWSSPTARESRTPAVLATCDPWRAARSPASRRRPIWWNGSDRAPPRRARPQGQPGAAGAAQLDLPARGRAGHGAPRCTSCRRTGRP